MEHCSKTLIAFVVIFLTANLIFLIYHLLLSPDISIPKVPIQGVSEAGRRHSKDATEEESIKDTSN